MDEADCVMLIDQESNRESQNSAVKFSQLRISHHCGIVHRVFAINAKRGCFLVVHGNTDHLQALSPIFTLPGHKARHFDEAWAAPACPKIQQHDLAAEEDSTTWLRLNAIREKFGAAWPTTGAGTSCVALAKIDVPNRNIAPVTARPANRRTRIRDIPSSL